MEQLVRGWGNEAWSADSELLTAALEWLPRTKGAIAECGSGLSTLVLASAAAVAERQLTSFEHDPAWAARLLQDLPAHAQTSVDLCVTPIRSYGDFDWYSLEGVAPPQDIGFVLCDGPPGSTRGGRYGLGPLLRPFLAPGCIILLDDTQRPHEHEIVRRWCTEMDASVAHEGGTFSVLSVGHARRSQERTASLARH
jgi:hypothetical protein